MLTRNKKGNGMGGLIAVMELSIQVEEHSASYIVVVLTMNCLKAKKRRRVLGKYSCFVSVRWLPSVA